MKKIFFLLPFVVILVLFMIAPFLMDKVSLEMVTDLRNISLAIAFLGGVLSIFSPCTVAVVPAFLSYALNEKKDIAKVTAVFFAGFSVAFMLIGILVAYLGSVTYVYFQNKSSDLIVAAGFLLVVFGLLTILGKGFSFINIGLSNRHDLVGIFLFGLAFAVGWSACTGPIIAGILSIAASFHNYAYAALLLFFYALGIAVPLFFMAFAYDRYNIAESRLVKGREFSFKLFGEEFLVHSTKLVAGLLLVVLGILFIVFRGTTVLTNADLFGRFIVFVTLAIASYLVYRTLIGRIKSLNLRHSLAAVLVIAAISLFMLINSVFTITTVGYAEFFDRLALQNSLVSNIIGALLLVFFALLALFLIFKKHADGK